jgi:hypothetical protein
MFNLTLDTAMMIAELDDIRRNQVPFAMALAMNRTMEEVQEAQIKQVERAMTIRNRRFILQLIKIAPEDRAFKDRLAAGIRVEGKASDPRASVYSDPAKSETEALSYLTLGRPLTSLSGDEARQLGAAKSALSAGTVNSYVYDSPGLIGGCVMKGTPSWSFGSSRP